MGERRDAGDHAEVAKPTITGPRQVSCRLCGGTLNVTVDATFGSDVKGYEHLYGCPTRAQDSTLPVELTWGEVRYFLSAMRRDLRGHQRNHDDAASHDNILRREQAAQSIRKFKACIERLSATDERFSKWDEADEQVRREAARRGEPTAGACSHYERPSGADRLCTWCKHPEGSHRKASPAGSSSSPGVPGDPK